jgi:MtrB/PioB family decaheme-associated outer membrane protein
MGKPHRTRSAAAAAATVLLAARTVGAGATGDAAPAPADSPAPVDTSSWACTKCPFPHGYAGSAEGGAIYASGANAEYGRYTGIDHTGPYVDAAAAGQWRDAQGYDVSYDLERLGLASRDGVIEGGREGRYDLRLSYDGQPQDLYDRSTTPLKIETERRTTSLIGRYFASPDWTLFGKLGHEEKDGNELTSASFVTQALQFAAPINYVTNSLDAGAAWSGRRASLRLNFTDSWFQNDNAAAQFANPYATPGSGATSGDVAEAPGNILQQVAASGGWQIPWFASTLNYDASLGRLRQDAGFLPVSTLSAATVPGANSLDGEVHLSHYSLALSTRPLSRVILRGRATYDGRDDSTRPIAVNYVVTDTVPGGTAVTPRYSEDRTRFDGTADATPWRMLHVGVGGEFLYVHYAPGQVLTHTQDVESWVRISVTPLESVTVAVKYGDGLRKDSPTDLAALPFGESTLVRDYNYAGRDRVFSTLTATWTATATLAWSVQGALNKDDYRSSPLGLQSLHEQRYSTTLTWTPQDTLSAYVDAGYQQLFTWQNGATDVLSSPWMISDSERFWNLSIGGRWVPEERWTVTLDYLLAPSTGDTDSALGGASQAFPQNWTKLDSARFGASYQWTQACQIRLRYERETYHSRDWALAGVGPGAIPDLAAFGIEPYRDNINLVALSLRYQF